MASQDAASSFWEAVDWGRPQCRAVAGQWQGSGGCRGDARATQAGIVHGSSWRSSWACPGRRCRARRRAARSARDLVVGCTVSHASGGRVADHAPAALRVPDDHPPQMTLTPCACRLTRLRIASPEPRHLYARATLPCRLPPRNPRALDGDQTVTPMAIGSAGSSAADRRPRPRLAHPLRRAMRPCGSKPGLGNVLAPSMELSAPITFRHATRGTRPTASEGDIMLRAQRMSTTPTRRS